MLYISKNTLQCIKDTMLNINIEVCGHLLRNEQKEDNELTLQIQNYGPEIEQNQRGSCTNSFYTPFIWHSHPNSVLFYPSVEDILKIIKDRKKDVYIKKSVIFTEYGIWLLSTKKYISDEEVFKYLSIKINKVNDWLYYKTNKGRELHMESVYKYMKDIDFILKKFEYICKFTLWDEIKKNYILSS